mgnify:CR=1 FL=1
MIGDYGDIRGEVNACRTSAALFDFSFMFVAKVSGRAALDIIKQITDRNFGDMDSGKIRYALSYSSEGFLRSDLTIWKISTDTFFVMSGLGKDIDALIDGLDKIITKKRDIQQATMQQLLTGRRRLPGSGRFRDRPGGDAAAFDAQGMTPLCP